MGEHPASNMKDGGFMCYTNFMQLKTWDIYCVDLMPQAFLAI